VPITIEVDDDELFTSDEKARLKEVFQDTGTSDYEEAMTKIVHAALCEYGEMMLGSGMPRVAEDIRRLRLLHLIKQYFGVRLPSEEEVARVFQQTPSSSQSLIRSLIHNPRHELSHEVRVTLAQTMCRCYSYGQNGEYRVIIRSPNVLEELKRIVCLVAPRLFQIAKVRYTASTYSMSKDTYHALLRYLLHEAFEDAEYDEANDVYRIKDCFPCMVDELNWIQKDEKVQHTVRVVREEDEETDTGEVSSDAYKALQALLRQ
jgi:hypothetical protein